jgi:hypothetical protein
LGQGLENGSPSTGARFDSATTCQYLIYKSMFLRWDDPARCPSRRSALMEFCRPLWGPGRVARRRICHHTL